MNSPRVRLLAILGLSAALCVPQAQAQQRPAVSRAKSPVAKPAPRFRAVPKSPIAALAARGANPAGPFARITEVQRDSIVENTRSLLGIKYKWAGATPERGIDCSGLVQYVFAKLGISLPHHAATLAKMGTSIAKDTSEMQPGDLLVFSKHRSKRISHVGIYVGDGMMIHASAGKKSVVETPVIGFRAALLRGVRRVVAVDTTTSGPGSN